METIYPQQVQHRLNQLLKLPVWVFSTSFTIGTIILLLHLYGERELSLTLGILFIMFALAVNATLFSALLLCSYLFKEYQTEILQKASILLINIPVVVLYMYIVIADPFSLHTSQF